MNINTQNNLLLNKLMQFYDKDDNLNKMLSIINGESTISLRIVDWFVTNYSKKYYIVYDIDINNTIERFKVYTDYKLKLKAFSKKRFDPFCRWDRITIPYKNNVHIQTTLGQLNFFKWALEKNIINYIKENYSLIDDDMNNRNSYSKSKNSSISSNSSSSSTNSSTNSSINSSTNSSSVSNSTNNSDEYNLSHLSNNKTRKKREELSINALRSMKKESIPTIIALS
jgi:hypothetical protein